MPQRENGVKDIDAGHDYLVQQRDDDDALRLDVVIVTYRSAAHLPACLAALPAAAQVVVVDNASDDNSAAVAEAAGVHVVRNHENRGFAAAANQGAREGDGDLVLFLNPDAVVAARDIRLLCAAFTNDNRLGAAGPRLVAPTGGEQQAWWPLPSPGGTWVEALAAHRLLRRQNPRKGFVVGACLVVRRVAFDAMCGFDERFWLYGEETDLCRRLWDSGWKVRLVPEATATHVGGASGDGPGGVAFEHFQRGAELYIAKHNGATALVLHRIGLLVGSALRLPALVLLGDEPRAATRRRVAARLARQLVTHPTRVGAGP